GSIDRLHAANQIDRVHRVGVRVQAAKVLQRCPVDHGARGRPQFMLQQAMSIRPGYRGHRVKTQSKASRKQRMDRFKVKEAAHDFGIIGHRVYDFYDCEMQPVATQLIQRQIGAVQRVDLVNLQRTGIDGLGDFFGCRAAIGNVVLDAKVAFWTSGIVAGGQHDPTHGAVAANDRTDGRGGQDAAPPDQNLGVTLRGGHAQNDLNCDAVVITPVTAHLQSLALSRRQHIEQRLHKIFQVEGLLKYGDLLAQSRGAGTLAVEGTGGTRDKAHGQRGSLVWFERLPWSATHRLVAGNLSWVDSILGIV